MKITVEKNRLHRSGNYAYKLNASIMKAHFKELMKYTVDYNGYEKKGYIHMDYDEEFLNLVERINNSDSKAAKADHAKTMKEKKNRNSIKPQPQLEPFDDWWADLYGHPPRSLEEAREWRKQWRG